MDGTLVDTEPYWMAAETPLVESFGGSWSHEQALGLVGLGLEDSARIFQDAGVRMGVRDIIDHLTDEVMRQLAETGVPFRPGARELLAGLRAVGVKTGLVTMSMRWASPPRRRSRSRTRRTDCDRPSPQAPP